MQDRVSGLGPKAWGQFCCFEGGGGGLGVLRLRVSVWGFKGGGEGGLRGGVFKA